VGYKFYLVGCYACKGESFKKDESESDIIPKE
jgi:hypothetical protein